MTKLDKTDAEWLHAENEFLRGHLGIAKRNLDNARIEVGTLNQKIWLLTQDLEALRLLLDTRENALKNGPTISPIRWPKKTAPDSGDPGAA